MISPNSSTAASAEPMAPDIRDRDLFCQFMTDIQGKEVQSAATYSYMWIADQFGHVGIALLLYFLLGRVFGLGTWMPWLIVSIAVALWELRAYRIAIEQSTWPQMLDEPTLRRNAIIATTYMIFGASLGLAFAVSSLLLFLVIAVLAFVCARDDMLHKIIWQKAGLPYLFRLADAKKSLSQADVDNLQALMAGAPPQPVILYGPLGSGRTSLATGIGTEFAFKQRTARYTSFDKMEEYIRQSDSKTGNYDDDSGPPNIDYWPWPNAQLLVFDDVHTGSGAKTGSALKTSLKAIPAPIKEALAARHTIWVFGDLLAAGGQKLVDDITDQIAAFSGTAPMVIALSL